MNQEFPLHKLHEALHHQPKFFWFLESSMKIKATAHLRISSKKQKPRWCYADKEQVYLAVAPIGILWVVINRLQC